MCLLTFIPPHVMPDRTALTNGTLVNDDGHGYALIADGQIVVGHGMDAQATIDAFITTRAAHPEGPALFHSRFTTHGTTRLDNCHPFPVGGDTRTVLAHNGVLPRTVQPQKGDPRSDSRITAEDYLPTFGSLRYRRNRLRLERWMTDHNKIVILTVDRRYRHTSYILNEDAGIWNNGIWYSNDGYLPPLPIERGLPMWGRSTLEELSPSLDTDPRPGDDHCWTCGNPVAGVGFCPYCRNCVDCGLPEHLCLCYTPATPTQPTRGLAELWDIAAPPTAQTGPLPERESNSVERLN